MNTSTVRGTQAASEKALVATTGGVETATPFAERRRKYKEVSGASDTVFTRLQCTLGVAYLRIVDLFLVPAVPHFRAVMG